MSVHMRRFTVSGTVLAFALTAVGVGPAAHADAPALSLRPAVASAVPAPPSKALPAALDVYKPATDATVGFTRSRTRRTTKRDRCEPH
jgi:hypothetical protein